VRGGSGRRGLGCSCRPPAAPPAGQAAAATRLHFSADLHCSAASSVSPEARHGAGTTMAKPRKRAGWELAASGMGLA
jgi:hypothetical protein